VPLFSDRGGDAPTIAQAEAWIDEADHLGLVARTSQSSDARQLHPLLREFLVRNLRLRHNDDAITAMHLSVAKSLGDAEPLVASRHYIEAGEHELAMECLGRSVLLTMGSGQWGIASDLVERLITTGHDPVVGAIRARGLMDEGRLEEASAILQTVDHDAPDPEVRAVLRSAQFSLAWRQSDRPAQFRALEAIRSDAESPSVLRDMAEVFLSATSSSKAALPYPALADRLVSMSDAQLDAGYGFFAAISMHNAAIVTYYSGAVRHAVRRGERALELFDQLSFTAVERFSTHATLATCWAELGNTERSEEHISLATSSGDEHADVLAEIAHLRTITGSDDEASEWLARSELQRRRGLTDIEAETRLAIARSHLTVRRRPQSALDILREFPTEPRPFDVADTFGYDAAFALALLLVGSHDESHAIADASAQRATELQADIPATRLRLLAALARPDPIILREAVLAVCRVGSLGLVELADGVASALDALNPLPSEVAESVAKWPKRWLPVLRRQLQNGNTANARAASLLLDQHGDPSDVHRLRAFAKAYSRAGRVSQQLGVALAKRAAPRLELIDLGRVRLQVGPRTVDLSAVRRKPAALLLYLATRPNFTATRDQVIDELWPDTEPGSASNSLNQSLYYLRREIDPWYEDDLSVDYITFQSDILWLDADLVRVASLTFLTQLKANQRSEDAEAILAVVAGYTGQFAPEFEYEEWAIAWRSRVHAAFLEFAHGAIVRLRRLGRAGDARDVALIAFEADPEARDVEIELIKLYWELGARSAARAQYDHFAYQERADGLEPVKFEQLCLAR
jgi:DNA-binding SARP family transcriptional activator